MTGDELKAIRNARGLSTTEFGRALGYSVSRCSHTRFRLGLHWQQSPAVFSLVDFGFSPFQLLIFDQQQIALASKFIRFAKRNIALA